MSHTPPAKDSASVHSRDSGHSHHSFSSLLPRVHSHGSIASALLGPALTNSTGISITHDTHNPFALGALGEDGKRKKSRKSRLANAGRRSLSPFRHHSSSSKRSSSVAPLPKDDRRGSADARSDTDGETGESGDEPGASSSRRRIGLTPRNNAFSADSDGDAEGDEEWERVPGAEEGAEASPRKSTERVPESASGSDHETTGDEETEDDEDEYLEFDDETIDNTLRNAGCIGLHDAWQHDAEPAGYGPSDYDASHLGEMHPSGHEEDAHLAEAPNVVLGEQQAPSQPRTFGTKANEGEHALTASRPVFERNRCTITLVHGEYEKAARENKRPKRYVVASDGSDEASYAIEWCIGTVLRDGDETLVCSVMETDAKLDASNPSHEDKANRLENQKLRQSMAVILARQVTATLQRTRLGVKVSCQALHARNSRHMICDLLDYYSPTMCIVGSRGLGSLKGILLGSTSHYLVQKSPVPVMVARRRLRLPALPRGKNDVVASVRRRHMSLDQAAIEKDSNVADEDPDEEREAKSSDATGADSETKAETTSTEESEIEPSSSSADHADEATTPTAEKKAESKAEERSSSSAAASASATASTSTAKRNEKMARDVAASKQKVSSPCPEDLAEAEAERQRSKNESKAAAAAAAAAAKAKAEQQAAEAKDTDSVTEQMAETNLGERGRSPEPRPTAETPAATG